MLFVLVGWVVFRAASFTVAESILMSLVGGGRLGGAVQEINLLVIAALVLAVIPSAHEIIRGMRYPHRALAAAGALVAVYCLLKVGEGAPVSFIYFQF